MRCQVLIVMKVLTIMAKNLINLQRVFKKHNFEFYSNIQSYSDAISSMTSMLNLTDDTSARKVLLSNQIIILMSMS